MREWLRRWHDRRGLWRGLAVLATLVIVYGSLTPGAEMPDTLPWDKASHFIGYGGLAGLLGLSGLRLGRAFLTALALGALVEFLQIPVAGRSGGDWQDILANTLGAAAAVLVLQGLRLTLLRHPVEGS
jgi:VanZ family protein